MQRKAGVPPWLRLGEGGGPTANPLVEIGSPSDAAVPVAPTPNTPYTSPTKTQPSLSTTNPLSRPSIAIGFLLMRAPNMVHGMVVVNFFCWLYAVYSAMLECVHMKAVFAPPRITDRRIIEMNQRFLNF